ncbi:MAG: hypothetical protein M5U26_14940 [Planctomycetota bacterium]|nr:hypothetical protein [Planctomycetota bacterium]
MRATNGATWAMLAGAVLLGGCGSNAKLVPAPAAPPAPPQVINRDLETYPQDAPKAALGSVIKALEAGRADYFLAFLLTPASRDQNIVKNGSPEAAVAKILEDPERLRRQVALFKKFLEADDVQEVEIEQGEKQAKACRFRLEGQSAFLQFEPDQDLWALNAHVGKPDPSAPAYLKEQTEPEAKTGEQKEVNSGQ